MGLKLNFKNYVQRKGRLGSHFHSYTTSSSKLDRPTYDTTQTILEEHISVSRAYHHCLLDALPRPPVTRRLWWWLCCNTDSAKIHWKSCSASVEVSNLIACFYIKRPSWWQWAFQDRPGWKHERTSNWLGRVTEHARISQSLGKRRPGAFFRFLHVDVVWPSQLDLYSVFQLRRLVSPASC